MSVARRRARNSGRMSRRKAKIKENWKLERELLLKGGKGIGGFGRRIK